MKLSFFQGYHHLYHNQINARALIGQSAMVYCAGKPMEAFDSQVEEFVNYEPATRDLRILLVFFQQIYQPINHRNLWFIA